MSKKVARLTKVIFILNTKNDESDLVLRDMKEAYEAELTRIVEASNE